MAKMLILFGLAAQPRVEFEFLAGWTWCFGAFRVEFVVVKCEGLPWLSPQAALFALLFNYTGLQLTNMPHGCC
jgi:hypothetical protein